MPGAQPEPTAEVVVDDLDSNTSSSGTWRTSSGPDPWAGHSAYSDAGGTFRWMPELTQAGTYTVYARWTYHANRSSSVPYRIGHSGGEHEVIVDQRAPSQAGQWRVLGSFDFAAGSAGYVEVSSENGQASADAVRFVAE